MTLAQLKTQLATTGYSVAYRAFPEGSTPSLPFIVYMVDGSENFLADNVVYYGQNRVTIQLCTNTKDLTAEGTVEQALSGLVWEKEEDYIDSERMYMISYTITI